MVSRIIISGANTTMMASVLSQRRLQVDKRTEVENQLQGDKNTESVVRMPVGCLNSLNHCLTTGHR